MAQTAQTDRFGVPLKGWSLASLYAYPEDGEGTLVMVACENCGDGFITDAPDDDTLCTACSLPPAEVAALRMVPAPVAVIARPTCEKCGFFPLAANAPRCAACTRLYASLTDFAAPRKENAIAA